MSARQRSPRLLLWPALVLALVTLGAACGGSDSGGSADTTLAADLTTEEDVGPPQSGGSIAFGLLGETNNWNPYEGQWASSAYIVGNAVFDPLTAVNVDGDTEPYLAESVTSNDDFTEWTITLRPGIKFHNGEDLDAAALETNLETGQTSGLTAVVFAAVSDITQVDDLSVMVTMRTPWATFPQTLSAQPGYIAAPAMLASEDGARNPVGTGPFEFENWVVDATLDVARNDDYWQDGFPYLDSIEFQVLADTQSRTQSLKSGSVDAIQVATPEQILDFQELGKDGEYQSYTDVGREVDETIIALNTETEPFNDPVARQAIATGIDQDVLAETSFLGALPGARGPFTPESPFYVPPDELGYPEYDLARAQELVEEYKSTHDGETVRFTALVPTDPTYQAIAQGLQATAAEAGIEVEIQAMEQTQLITRVLTGDYQAAGFILFSSPTFDRAYPFIATQSAPYPAISLNFTRNDNQTITDAMDAARETDDPEGQLEAFRIVQEEMAKDLDRIFLVHNVGGMAYTNDVHGFLQAKFPDTEEEAIPGYGVGAPFTHTVWRDN
jgi:peptide/nickel transport system substrate-binding protein